MNLIEIEKNIIPFLRKNVLAVFSWTFVICYTLFGLVIPFLRFNKLVNWDMVGLYFSAWYEKMYLFPKIIGWNPFFFLGYPQHQFYPPLYAYLTAALSYIIPLNLAFKIMFIITIILLPLSFYYFVKSFGFDRKISSALMMIMFSILFLFPTSYYGGNFQSTFTVGLITHALGMALFFFYFGALHKSVNSKNKKFILPSVLFALIILTHIIAAFAATFVAIAYVICYIQKKGSMKFIIKHITLVFLLCAFWIIPFIAKRAWLAAIPVGINEGYTMIGLTALWLIIIFFTKNEKVLPVAIFIVLILFFSFIATYFIYLPIHLYRFMMYLYILIPFAFVTVKKYYKIIGWILFITALAFILFAPRIHSEGANSLDLQKLNLTIENNSRVLILPAIINEATPHIIQHLFPMENKVLSLKGLYVESAKNGKYIFYIDKELNPKNSFTWWEPIQTEKISSNFSQLKIIIEHQISLFNINWIIGQEDMLTENITIYNYSIDKKIVDCLILNNISLINKNNSIYLDSGSLNNCSFNSSNLNISLGNVYYVYNQTLKKEQKIASYKNEDYYLYKSGNFSLFEILNYTPKVVKDNWNDKVLDWFLSKNFR